MSSLINRKGFTFIELLVVIIAVILFLWFSPSVFNKLSELFNTNEPGYIRVTDIPGLTDYSKQILKSEDYVIVPDKIKVSPNQMLELYVRPVQGKLFSEQSILIKPQVQNLNQLLAEIKFTTDFYDSLTKTYIYSGIKGFFDVVVSIIKGFFSFIWDTICYVFHFMFHPIDSFRELFSTSKKVVTTVVKNPRVIVELPIDMANGFLDEVEIDIAKRNHIDIKKIYLKETLVSLRHKRNIEVGAQSITAVVGIFVPGSTVIPARVGAVGKMSKTVKSSVIKLKQIANVEEKGFVKQNTLRRVEEGTLPIHKLPANKDNFTKEMPTQRTRNEKLTVHDNSAEKKTGGLNSNIKRDKDILEEELSNELAKGGKEKFIKESESLDGGGDKGTRRADGVIVNDSNKTLTQVETKSEKEIKDWKGSWCTYNDYLKECRDKVLYKMGGKCTASTAWAIQVACQSNCYRQNLIKNKVLNNEQLKYKLQRATVLPTDKVDELRTALLTTGLRERTDFIVESIGNNLRKVIIDDSAFNKLEKQFDIKNSVVGKCVR